MKPKTDLLFLNSFRALTAIYVVANHAVVQYYDPAINYNLVGIHKWYVKFFSFGHFAVNLFIVLSGFSLMLSVIQNGYIIKGGALTFLKRRVIRIVPPYYFAILFSLLLIWLFIGNKTGTHWDISIPVTMADVLRHVFFIHDFFKSTTAHINHVFWSIAVECRIYLFFPLLVLLWRMAGPLVTLCVSIIIAIAGTLFLFLIKNYYPDIDLFSPGISPYIILFALGMLAADLSFAVNGRAYNLRMKYLKHTKINRWAGLIGFLGIYLGIKKLFSTFAAFPHHIDVYNAIQDVLLGVVFAYLLFVCSVSSHAQRSNNWILRFLNWRPLVFIGTFSYSLYLIHAPLIQMITQYILFPLHVDNYASSLIILILGTPIIVCISYGYFLIFERPFLNYGKKIKKDSDLILPITEPAP